MRARDYRLAASEECRNYSGTLALIYLILAIIEGAVSGATFGLGILVLGPLTMGTVMVSESVHNKGNVALETLFSGFKMFEKAVVLSILETVYLILWSLLIIPAFIKPYSYAMSFYIQKDNPEMTANESITESRRMMNGYKWKLFCLDLSYIGWILLCILTLGILSFWVSPKIQQAHYLFYLNISGKNNQEEVVTEE